MGYGAAQKDGDPYTLYMYGKPADSDPEGVYRSTDCGKSWILINQNHLYGGTGNGNYLVGDMNTFGTVYMSTVGCGIVVGKVTGSEGPKPVTTEATKNTTATTTTKASTTTTATGKATTTAKNTTTTPAPTTLPQTETSVEAPTTSGQGTAATTTTVGTTVSINPSVFYGDVNLDGDVDLADAVLLNKAVAGSVTLNQQAALNADCNNDGKRSADDSMVLLKFLVHLVNDLPAAN